MLMTAAHTLVERGYDGTSVNDIAAALGLTKSGLYHHIDSKESLLFDIITIGMNALDDEVIAPTRALSDPEERFRQIVRRHATLTTGENGVITLLVDEVRALAPSQRRKIDERRRAYFHYVRDTVRAMKAAGKLRDVDPTVAAFAILGMIVWLPHWFKPGGRLTSEQVAAEIEKLACCGVLPPSAASTLRASVTPAGGRRYRRLDLKLFPRLNARRFEICMTAARTIVQRGFSATSMNDIAQALGVTKAGLYHYISSKDELFYEIVRLGMDWLAQDVIEPLEHIQDPEEHLTQLISRQAALTACTEPWITTLLDEMQGLSPTERRKIERRKRAYFELVRNQLRALHENGRLRAVDPSVAAYSMLGTIIFIPQWLNPRGLFTGEQAAAQVADIALHGIMSPDVRSNS